MRLAPHLAAAFDGSRSIVDASRPSGCHRSLLTMLMPGTAATVATGRRSAAGSLGELRPRHGNLGHLEGDMAAVGHHLRADLDQLLLQAGQRPVLDRLGRRQGSLKPHAASCAASSATPTSRQGEHLGASPHAIGQPRDVEADRPKDARERSWVEGSRNGHAGSGGPLRGQRPSPGAADARDGSGAGAAARRSPLGADRGASRGIGPSGVVDQISRGRRPALARPADPPCRTLR